MNKITVHKFDSIGPGLDITSGPEIRQILKTCTDVFLPRRQTFKTAKIKKTNKTIEKNKKINLKKKSERLWN